MAKAPIIIIKRVKRHSSHHGGAWKVAYADFVTAMMALFIVLWLLNTSEHTKKVIAGYFNDPMGTRAETGSDRAGTADALPFTKENIEKLKEQLQKQIEQTANLKDISNQVEMKITPEGLRIELLESKDGTFFDTGSTSVKPDGRAILNLLAAKLSTVPNKVSIEGHTDAQPFSGATIYSNWELSEDRANVARRLMQRPGGLRPNQVSQVRGFADQRLRTPQAPFDPSNRRISLIVQYRMPDDLPPSSSEVHQAVPAVTPVSSAPAVPKDSNPAKDLAPERSAPEPANGYSKPPAGKPSEQQ